MPIDWDMRHGNCLEVLQTLPADSVEAIVTDPPYGLRFMGRSWDYQIPSQAIWEQALRVLKPGGHMLSFGGSRTFHRMACTIEDAGFEVRDTIMWVYGSGFPKSHNVANSIDKLHGAPNRGHRIATAGRHHPDGTVEPNGELLPPYVARTEAGRPWQGWGTALKPAYEPIIVARKPLIGTVAENVLAHGCGGINVDGCRVPMSPGDAANIDGRVFVGSPPSNSIGKFATEGHDKIVAAHPLGRWPANLILSYPEDEYAMIPTATSEQKRELFRWLHENS